MDKLKAYIQKTLDSKNANEISEHISKSMDFQFIMPDELLEHRQVRERYRILAKLTAEKSKGTSLTSFSQRLSKRV